MKLAIADGIHYFGLTGFPLAIRRVCTDADNTPSHPHDLTEVEHRHDFCEMVVVTRGGAMQWLEGKEFPVTAGDVFLLQGRQRHYFPDRHNLDLIMKIAVPTLGAAFAGQLAAAEIPFQDLSRLVVPYIEIGGGCFLMIGFHTRIATLLVFNIMIVATYVHLVVNDPSLFPLQPEEPIIPAVVTIFSSYILLRGGGSGSADLKTST